MFVSGQTKDYKLVFVASPNLSIIYFIGLSPDLQSMEQIRRIMRPTDVPDTGRFDNKTF
jgi:serine/threonine-protein phosphatase PP1 catalytic subunit